MLLKGYQSDGLSAARFVSGSAHDAIAVNAETFGAEGGIRTLYRHLIPLFDIFSRRRFSYGFVAGGSLDNTEPFD